MGLDPTEQAHAKVNLTLAVLGKRSDGYHELESLVAFADLADDLSYAADAPTSRIVTGPCAASLSGPNLIEDAFERAQRAGFDVPVVGGFTLTKRIPVAAGLGGGSADAAAALRLLAHLAPGSKADWALLGQIGRTLGADVPVCVRQTACWMRGLGDRLGPEVELPELYAVLVNPGIAVSTADVFKQLASGPVPTQHGPAEPLPDRFATVSDLVAFLRGRQNDLEAPARKIAPDIDAVLSQTGQLPGCLLARMSGSGATCFGLFGDNGSAQSAAEALAASAPGWWVHAARIGSFASASVD